jgi:hypothetical protein
MTKDSTRKDEADPIGKLGGHESTKNKNKAIILARILERQIRPLTGRRWAAPTRALNVGDLAPDVSKRGLWRGS